MVSLREFASHVGKSPALISRLIKRGIIPRNVDGTIPLEAGLHAFSAYDNAPKNVGGRPRVEKEPTPKPASPPPKVEVKQTTARASPPPQVDVPISAGGQSAVAINSAMNKAKLAETTYKAKLRQLEFELESKESVKVADVKKEAQWLAEQVKSKLMAIPPRISSMCEGRIAREIEEIITDAINSALKELQKCKYTGE